MLALILIYFTGKSYVNLAKEYGKNKWLYGFLGVFSYYGGILIFGVAIGVLMELGYLEFLRDVNETLLEIICIPFGVLICWGFYVYLKTKWWNTSANNRSNSVILDD